MTRQYEMTTHDDMIAALNRIDDAHEARVALDNVDASRFDAESEYRAALDALMACPPAPAVFSDDDDDPDAPPVPAHDDDDDDELPPAWWYDADDDDDDQSDTLPVDAARVTLAGRSLWRMQQEWDSRIADTRPALAVVADEQPMTAEQEYALLVGWTNSIAGMKDERRYYAAKARMNELAALIAL